MISAEGIRKVEKKANEIGLTFDKMMENAGGGSARIVDEKYGMKGKRVLIFCGTGNNAGDGLVFARHALIYGAIVHVYFIKGHELLRSDEARNNFRILVSLRSLIKHVKFHDRKLDKLKPDILVDAMFGTGLRSKVTDEYQKAINLFNQMDAKKVSIDCPSGIDCDTGESIGAAVKPDLTITFYDLKKGLTEKNSGKIVVCPIGFPRI